MPGSTPQQRALSAHPDLSAFWMPFTANRQFKAAPRLLTQAKGMYYTSDAGRQILDATSGLWCVAAGHNRDEIVAAMKAQLDTLDYAPCFQMGHPLAFEAASAVARFTPPGLDRIFFTNSGSEAVDTALKIAIAWQRARGEGQRTRLIGRERGYHGVGFGGISVGGIAGVRKSFPAHMLPGVDHLGHTLDLPRAAFTRGQPEGGAELADQLEALIALHDASTIAAVIVEPVAGSTGVLIPPRGYLERLRELCTRHGIVLIFDEVITGFGRLGAATAAEFFGVTPDLMTFAKAINNAAVPMGAVAVRRDIHDSVLAAGADGQIEFNHGYTYSGHPLACAAAIAALELYRTEALFARAASLAPLFENLAHGLQGVRHVKDVRNLGLVAGIELEARPGAPGQRAYECLVRCFERGVLIRVTGDIIAISPPLIVAPEQLDHIFATLSSVIGSIA